MFMPLCACYHLGPSKLVKDTTGYSQALGDSQNQQTLLNIVRLRYDDTPSFVQTTQIISSYQLQQSITAGGEAFPGAPTTASNLVGLEGSALFQQSPTFTLQPVVGQQFADSFIRPIASTELLPLVEGGIPIDMLFRLSVQSINDLQNGLALGGPESQGSPAFFLLVHDLRVLQMAGLLVIGLHNGFDTPSVKAVGSGSVYLEIRATADPNLTATTNEVRHLLGMGRDSSSARLVSGSEPSAPGEVAILTRPMLGVLNQIAVQVEVPAADIASGETASSVDDIGFEHRPIVVVHSGAQAPARCFCRNPISSKLVLDIGHRPR